MERNLESQLQKEPRDILIKTGVFRGEKGSLFCFFVTPVSFTPSVLALQRQSCLEYLKNDTVYTTHFTLLQTWNTLKRQVFTNSSWLY